MTQLAENLGNLTPELQQNTPLACEPASPGLFCYTIAYTRGDSLLLPHILMGGSTLLFSSPFSISTCWERIFVEIMFFVKDSVNHLRSVFLFRLLIYTRLGGCVQSRLIF